MRIAERGRARVVRILPWVCAMLLATGCGSEPEIETGIDLRVEAVPGCVMSDEGCTEPEHAFDLLITDAEDTQRRWVIPMRAGGRFTMSMPPGAYEMAAVPGAVEPQRIEVAPGSVRMLTVLWPVERPD